MKHKLCRYCPECHDCTTDCTEAKEVITRDEADYLNHKNYKCKGIGDIKLGEAMERKHGTYIRDDK